MMEFARQVLDALPLTVYTTDLDGRITSANRSWSQFAEENGAPALAPEGDIIGQSIWSAVVDPGYRQQAQDAMETLRAGRAARVSWEFACSSPSEERLFLMQITPLRARHRVTGFVFSTVDITGSHRARQALIESGLALARTIDLDGVFHEVGQQLRLAVGADSFALLLGDGTELAVAHRSGYDDAGEELAPRLLALAGAAIEQGGVIVRHAGDDAIDVAAPLDGGERTIGALALRLDGVAHRHEIDAARRLLALLAPLAAQVAASIERVRLVRRVGHTHRLQAIDEVATGVARELRNPLFGISSAAQLLRFRSRDDPVVEKNVGRILRDVERLNRMVSALLEFERAKSLSLAPGDPDAVWDDVLDAQRGLVEARALALRRTRPHHPAACALDREQLGQLFLNLLVNAVDHAPEGSDIALQSGILSDGSWRCRLTNAGPAIPPDLLPRVFEIFHSTRPGGTGIGLALGQRIVEAHHGTISMESTQEAGTTVVVTLPRVPG